MEEERKDVHIRIKVRLEAEEIFFGPGTCELMEKIEETGSIHEACLLMGLSYSKGSKMIRRMEQQLGYCVMERRAGGAGGGGSLLTERGRWLLETYKKMEQEIRQEAERIYRNYFPEDKIGETGEKQDETD